MSLEALPVSTSSTADPDTQRVEDPGAERTRKDTEVVPGFCMQPVVR